MKNVTSVPRGFGRNPSVQLKGGLLCEGGPSGSGRRPCESPHMRAPALRRSVEVAHE